MRLSHFLFTLTMSVLASGQELPSADVVVAKMMGRDNQRQTALHGYTGLRHYILENARHHKKAEMLVTVRCLDNGSKHFQTVSETGWGAAVKHVFPKLLEGESEASLPEFRERSRITPENYSFEMRGQDEVNNRPAYVIVITPKTRNKYLVQGKIWVDLEEYAVVRVEGEPAKNPSFWIKSVHFVHEYQKSGSFWLPSSDRSVTDAKIIGATNMTIDYFNYNPTEATLATAREKTPGSLP